VSTVPTGAGVGPIRGTTSRRGATLSAEASAAARAARTAVMGGERRVAYDCALAVDQEDRERSAAGTTSASAASALAAPAAAAALAPVVEAQYAAIGAAAPTATAAVAVASRLAVLTAATEPKT
jgi:hypothetical protein